MNARVVELMRHYLGLPGLLGLGLLLAGMGVYLLGALPAQKQVLASRVELSRAHAQPMAADVEAATELNDADALVAFYRQFPPTTQLTTQLEQLHDLAREQGVKLSQGEYKLIDEAGSKLLRYEILLPVESGYLHLRKFVDAAGRKFPTLGLSDISIKRDGIGEGTAQVKLNFVLYLSREP
jgi:hypothetical protein